MLLDPLTLLVMTILAILVTSGSYFIVWLQDRKQVALLWMMAATLLGVISFSGRILLPAVPAVMLTNPGILVAAGCIWMACRLLGGKRVLPWALILPSGVWLGLCALPVFMAQSGIRVAVLNLMLACLFALAAREIRRIGGSNHIARWWVFGVLALEGLACLGQGMLHAWSPGPNQANLEASQSFVFAVLASQGFVLLVSFAMIALVKEQSAQRDREAAEVDGLTGLANRRHLDVALADAVAVARHSGRPLALIMTDVDSFKAYNDLYGHLQGDTCLRAIADALRGGVVRKHDLVARYGGEEFAVLLPDTDTVAAESIAERLRLAVRQLALRHAGRQGGIATISLGGAVLGPGGVINSATELLQAADQALYRAKRLGRDRVMFHVASEPGPEAVPTPWVRRIAQASSDSTADTNGVG